MNKYGCDITPWWTVYSCWRFQPFKSHVNVNVTFLRYRTKPLAHLRYSGHISLMFIPAYRALLRCSKLVQNQVRTRPGGISALQDTLRFEHTDWDMFQQPDTSARAFMTPLSPRWSLHTPQQKLWMTAEVHKLQESTFRVGDKAALRTARLKLSPAIRAAKRAYGQRIHSQFQGSDEAQHMWKGIQAIINYRTICL